MVFIKGEILTSVIHLVLYELFLHASFVLFMNHTTAWVNENLHGYIPLLYLFTQAWLCKVF